jgi:uncharacterized protein
MRQELTASYLIDKFGMRNMETENVNFTQTWISSHRTLQGKPCGTAIVALLTKEPECFSDLHSLPTDEIWHFYLGDPIELLLLYPDGSDEIRILGQDLISGQHIQTTVRSGVWMGARLMPGGEFALYGNTMAPGYELDDFQEAPIERLLHQFPHRKDLILSMSRSK